MLQLLFFLAFFQTKIRVKTNYYFKYFQSLEYAFKKNAKFSIKIIDPTTQMVFGLATQKEIKKMIYKRDEIQYFIGEDKIATVQYKIKNTTRLTGTIPEKGTLTPFLFAYDNQCTFDLELNYTNGQDNGDYRIQNAVIYTSIFSGLLFITEICFIIYYKRQNSPRQKYHSFLDIYIILSSISLAKSSITLHFTSKPEHSNIFDSISILIIPNVFIFLTAHMILIFLNRNIKFIYNYIFFFLFSCVIILLPVVLRVVLDEIWHFFFIPASLYFLTMIFQLFLPSKMNFCKAGLIIYLIDFFFFIMVDKNYYIENDDSASTNDLLVNLNLLDLILTVVSNVMLLIGFIVFHELDIEDDNDAMINVPQINYTGLN